MFIREQIGPTVHWRHGSTEYTCADYQVWTPIACRHTNWEYLPLCRRDERGRIVPGSRRRDPFILSGAK